MNVSAVVNGIMFAPDLQHPGVSPGVNSPAAAPGDPYRALRPQP